MHGTALQAVLEMTVGLVEIRLNVELHHGTRVIRRDKPHLVRELDPVGYGVSRRRPGGS